MITVIDRLSGALLFLGIASLVILGSYFVYLWSKRRIVGMIVCAGILGSIGACIHGCFFALDRAVRKNIAAAVIEIRAGKGILYVEGSRIQEPEAYLRSLQEVKWFMVAHHSRPIAPSINMELRSAQGVFRVRLQRDFDREDECWVFSPDYRLTQDNDVGRVHAGPFVPWFRVEQEEQRRKAVREHRW